MWGTLLLVASAIYAHAQIVGSASHVEFTHKLIAAAIERTHHSVRYVSDYIRIPYPGGDSPRRDRRLHGRNDPNLSRSWY